VYVEKLQVDFCPRVFQGEDQALNGWQRKGYLFNLAWSLANNSWSSLRIKTIPFQASDCAPTTTQNARSATRGILTKRNLGRSSIRALYARDNKRGVRVAVKLFAVHRFLCQLATTRLVPRAARGRFIARVLRSVLVERRLEPGFRGDFSSSCYAKRGQQNDWRSFTREREFC